MTMRKDRLDGHLAIAIKFLIHRSIYYHDISFIVTTDRNSILDIKSHACDAMLGQ